MDYFELALSLTREQARQCIGAERQDETPNEAPANNDFEDDGA